MKARFDAGTNNYLFYHHILQTMTEGIELKCKKCEHTWIYKGKNTYYATCPNCLNKVRLPEED